MEIVCIDKQTFDELRVRFGKLEEKVMGMCREKGLIPFARIKHKIFFKTEDVHKLLESNYHHLKREL